VSTLEAQYYIDRTRLIKNELNNLKLEIRKREDDKDYVEYLEGVIESAKRVLDIITND
jgi:hypothetical protein